MATYDNSYCIKRRDEREEWGTWMDEQSDNDEGWDAHVGIARMKVM